MKLVDLYYKAFKSFRKHTIDQKEGQKIRKTISYANHQKEKFEAIKFDCKIESDWIENIEEGLKFVEKAILEDRQFIRTEGEVIPIEKVKRVSKASVEHLSRHSNLVSRIPKNDQETLTPDKLYIIERLSDHLVYENRFLYVLLRYLKDFIEIRLDKIKDKTTTYHSLMRVDKQIEVNSRHITYNLDFSEMYKNDPFLLEVYEKIPLVKNVENIHALTLALLSTPLMKEVAKAPMIKPPIVKTNVIRMNKNFKAALSLYDYITSYNKDGYTFEEIKKTFSPFPEKMGDEIADTIELNSLITYMEGNDIRSYLEERFEKELEKEKLKQSQAAQEELERLKKRLVELDEDPSLYILKLEKRNQSLEKDNLKIASLIDKNEQLLTSIETLEQDKRDMEKQYNIVLDQVNEKQYEIDILNQKYFDDMKEAEVVHQNELKQQLIKYEEAFEQQKTDFMKQLNDMKHEHESYIKDLVLEHQTYVDLLVKNHDEQRESLKQSYEEQINDLITKHQTFVFSLEENIDQLTSQKEKQKLEIKTQQKMIKDLELNLKSSEEYRRFANAQYLALKTQQGLISDDEDFTSKEKFQQLELEMKAYKKLFKEQWKKTKLQIKEHIKEEMLRKEDIE